MDPNMNVIRWIEAGKQVGERFYYTKYGQTYYQSVAIQKWNEFYTLYFFEILEKKMTSFEDEDELLERFHTLDEAITRFKDLTTIRLEELSPLKGQRIFNPELNQ